MLIATCLCCGSPTESCPLVCFATPQQEIIIIELHSLHTIHPVTAASGSLRATNQYPVCLSKHSPRVHNWILAIWDQPQNELSNIYISLVLAMMVW